MKTSEFNRRSKLTLTRGKTLRNRIITPPMASASADLDGFVTDKTLAHYQRLSEAQTALLIVEYTFIHPTGKSEKNQLGIQSDSHVDGLTKIANLIHKSGSLAGIQLTHSGGKSESQLTGGKLFGPSAIAVPVKDQTLEIPEPMNDIDIEIWKTAFAAAVDRAAIAGFDLIELHSAHGYGLNQWLSPITNQRNDKYGSDLNGRMRLIIEIINAIRAQHPKLLISVRMPGQDFVENGLTISEATVIAQKLEKAGVDIIHVSSGISGWRRSSSRRGEGYLVEEAAQIQASVSIPVIGVGGIQTAEYIDEGLKYGKFSLAAVGRAILENPLQFKNQILNPS